LKYLVFLIFSIFFSISISAQFLEFGGGIGGLNYSGDLQRGYQVNALRPAIQLNQRMNFSPHLSIRWGLTGGTLTATDAKPLDALSIERGESFTIRLLEISSVVEYHFLDYKHEKSQVRWSPYAFFGLGMFRFSNHDSPRNDFNRNQPVIPFGIGIKQLVGKRFSLGIELGMRYTFLDYLDNVSDTDISVKDFKYGNPVDNDFYYFTGISLSYILYKIPCPFPYVPNQYMLRTKFR